MSQIASVAEKFGWKSSLRLDDRVMIELMFWKENLRELNRWDTSVGRSCALQGWTSQDFQ